MEILEKEPSPQKSHRNDLLKIVALVTMLIDHVGYLYFPEEMMFRTIGRIAFPIFAYQVALGFQKTSSRPRYAKRLFVFALISQIPYLWFNPALTFDWQGLNIMFTLLYALGVLQALELSKVAWQDVRSSRKEKLPKAIFFTLLTLFLIPLPDLSNFTTGVGIEYGSTGVLFVVLFYLFGKSFSEMFIAYALLSLAGAYYSGAKWLHYNTGDSIWVCLKSFSTLYNNHIYYRNTLLDMSGVFFQARSILAVPIIALMNGWEGNGQIDIRLNKYIGYWFYPVHISILLIIKVVLQ